MPTPHREVTDFALPGYDRQFSTGGGDLDIKSSYEEGSAGAGFGTSIAGRGSTVFFEEDFQLADDTEYLDLYPPCYLGPPTPLSESLRLSGMSFCTLGFWGFRDLMIAALIHRKRDSSKEMEEIPKEQDMAPLQQTTKFNGMLGKSMTRIIFLPPALGTT